MKIRHKVTLRNYGTNCQGRGSDTPLLQMHYYGNQGQFSYNPGQFYCLQQQHQHQQHSTDVII